MAIVTLFKNEKDFINVSTPEGEVIRFVSGKYFTTNAKYAEYLQELADTNQCGVYVDPAEATIDTEASSPMEQLYAKIRSQVEHDIATGKINLAPQVSPGDSTQGKLGASNTMGTASAQGINAKALLQSIKVAGLAPSAETDKAPE